MIFLRHITSFYLTRLTEKITATRNLRMRKKPQNEKESENEDKKITAAK